MSLRPLVSRPAAAFALAWLALQIGTPIALLVARDRPVPFGWQMYAATRTPPPFQLEDRAGGLIEVDFFARVPHPRADVDYARLLPPFLCQQAPGAAAVHVGPTSLLPAERRPCP